MDLPMPMRFRHLKKTSKEAVGVYRYGAFSLVLSARASVTGVQNSKKEKKKPS